MDTIKSLCKNASRIKREKWGNLMEEVIILNREEQEELQRKKENERFNSITQKIKVENQNQTHNSKKEGLAPVNQKR